MRFFLAGNEGNDTNLRLSIMKYNNLYDIEGSLLLHTLTIADKLSRLLICVY